MRPVAVGVLLLLLPAAWPAAGQEAASAPSLTVVGTQFHVTVSDGRVRTSRDLRGAVLDVVGERGETITVRIEDVARDPSDADGDVWLHRFSVLDRLTGHWGELCAAGSDGTAAGFPLAGRWTGDGRHLRDPASFTVTCTSGAAGKCVRFGYKPWRGAEGESLWDYHQACVRAVRADYGGDGRSHTRDGTPIDLFDRLGIQRPEPDPGSLAFEGAWGPDGAVCVRRTRIPELLSSDELARRYPRLAGGVGSNCSEAVPALIWNRS